MWRLRKSASCDSLSENGSVPFSRRLPPLGASSVPMMNRSVLLPDPLGPRVAAFCPAATESDTSRSTTSGSLRVGKVLLTCSTTSSAITRQQSHGSQAVKCILDVVRRIPLGAAKSSVVERERLRKPPRRRVVDTLGTAKIFQRQESC